VANARGRSEVVPIPCGQDETSWGYVGALRSGAEALARHALGKRLLAQVRDPVTGRCSTSSTCRSAPGLPRVLHRVGACLPAGETADPAVVQLPACGQADRSAYLSSD
jgi:hypothetical protein